MERQSDRSVRLDCFAIFMNKYASGSVCKFYDGEYEKTNRKISDCICKKTFRLTCIMLLSKIRKQHAAHSIAIIFITYKFYFMSFNLSKELIKNFKKAAVRALGLSGV